MVLTFINLLQGQAAKVSWLLWAGAIVFFLAGLSLLIYLMTRPKETDVDEAEEEGQSLLSQIPVAQEKPLPAQETAFKQEPAKIAQEESADVNATIPLFSEADFIKPKNRDKAVEVVEAKPATQEKEEEVPASAATTTVTDDLAAQALPVISPTEAAPEISHPTIQSSVETTPIVQRSLETTPIVQTSAETTAFVETTGTQLLASETSAITREEATVPIVEQTTVPIALQEEPIFSPQEEALLSQEKASAAQDSPLSTLDATPAQLSQENISARVAAPIPQQRFEPAARAQREPFEPPTIEPMAPRQTTTQPSTLAASDESKAVKTTALGSQAVMPTDSEAMPSPSAQTKISSTSRQTSQIAQPVWETQGAGTRSIAKPAGSVLGLPAEVSDAPLVIGKPSHSKEDEGVAALSNYGKDLDATETGRGGAIALLLVILLVGGSVLAYFFIPSVHSWANNLAARIRGQQTTSQAPVEKAKAQIYPRGSEVNKNLVKARGAIVNISEEQLDELSVEISLDKGEGTQAEIRTVAVKPATLAPRQQGQFELEYEGSKATGFSRYKVTKLLSKNGEVKFIMPNQ